MSSFVGSVAAGWGLLLVAAGSAFAQGDDLEIGAAPASTPSAPTVAPSVPAAPVPQAPAADLRAEVDALRSEVRELREAEAARPDEPHDPARGVGLERWPDGVSSTSPWETPGRDGLWVTGYLQSQYESHQDSQDQLAAASTPLNRDRFLVRRARLKFAAEWQWVKAQVELNGDTTNGFNLNLHHAEATLQHRPDKNKVPLVQATLGLFDVPFGFELVESPRSRPFMERSVASRAFWPGEPDLGLRVSGGYDFFRYTVAAVNGHPLGDPSFAGRDPLSAKDVVVRLGVDSHPREDLRLGFDVSVLGGKGFHPGTDATKGGLQWVDLNEDGIVQPYELQGVPAAAPTPSQSFSHWAVGADLQASYRSRYGETRLYGEFVVAQNLDRGNVIADPIQATTDLRELGFYAGALQDITPYGLVGLRYDYYDPNSDFLDRRQGKLLPASQSFKTLSPLLGLVLPNRARLLFQYDVLRNFLARTAEGVPTNLKSNTWTLRLQVEL